MSIAAVVLAAGASTRLGRPKQLLRFDGETLLRRTTRIALEARCGPVIVVLGAEAELCQAEIVDLPVQIVRNVDWPGGIASSIRRGIDALQPATDAAILLVCDQPHVSPQLLRGLIAQRNGEQTIVGSRYADTIGVPALFSRVHFDELRALPGDSGAKSLFSRHGDAVAAVLFPAGATDIDLPADAAALVSDGAGFRDAPPAT